MTVELLSEENQQEYLTFLKNIPDATFEYTLKWRDLLRIVFGFKPYYLVSKDGSGRINGILPLFKAKNLFGERLVSTPYSIYTGVLCNKQNTYFIHKNLFAAARQLAIDENVNYLELREKETVDTNIISQDFLTNATVFNFSLRLSRNPEEVWKKLPKGSIRWGIKKAKKSGVYYKVGASCDDLDIFYSLYVQTRKFRGVPGYPYSYFKQIITNFGNMEDSNIRIYTAFYNEKPIASIFLIYYNKEMRYAFAGAMHKPQYMDLQPYHLILWQAIEDASMEGYLCFNLGGATMHTNEGGLFEFKKKWADTIQEIPSYFFLNKIKNLPIPNDSIPFKLASMAWKKMPLSWTKLLNPVVIKQFV